MRKNARVTKMITTRDDTTIKIIYIFVSLLELGMLTNNHENNNVYFNLFLCLLVSECHKLESVSAFHERFYQVFLFFFYFCCYFVEFIRWLANIQTKIIFFAMWEIFWLTANTLNMSSQTPLPPSTTVITSRSKIVLDEKSFDYISLAIAAVEWHFLYLPFLRFEGSSTSIF